MSVNVLFSYIKHKKKVLTSYAETILANHYDKKIFSPLLDAYIDVKYYDVEDLKNSKNILITINDYVTSKAKEIIDKKNKDKVLTILYFFEYIYFLDDVVNYQDDLLLDKINVFRRNELGLNDLDTVKFLKEIKINNEKEIEYLDNFKDKNFKLKVTDTNIKNVYDVVITHNVKVPKLYSDYAIDNVFNNSLIAENKIFVETYMVAAQVIRDIESLEYGKMYLIEDKISLMEKPEKLNRLLNVLDDDLMKEHMVVKAYYKDYIKNRDVINKMINEGFKVAIVIGDDYNLNEDNHLILSLFTYVIVDNKEIAKSFLGNNLIIRDMK